MRRYLMIGAPVTSVRTPPLLERRLAELGVVAAVEAVHVDPLNLAEFMQRAGSDASLDGLMVTMPHKRTICDHLDTLSETARKSESVNAVKRAGTRLVGAQFDGIALRRALGSTGTDLRSARIWLAGLGGAGLAIAQALHGHCDTLFVTETDDGRLGAALSHLPNAVAMNSEPNRAADILVNATPLGMDAEDPSPFPDDAVSKAAVVADIVADPKATRLAARANAAGTRLVTGRMMVEHQIGPIADWLISDDIEQEA